jgi:hypothetical protein
MKSLTLTVPPSGIHLHITNRGEATQVVLVLPDGAEIEEQRAVTSDAQRKAKEIFSYVPVAPIENANGFPPRDLTALYHLCSEKSWMRQPPREGWRGCKTNSEYSIKAKATAWPV